MLWLARLTIGLVLILAGLAFSVFPIPCLIVTGLICFSVYMGKRK